MEKRSYYPQLDSIRGVSFILIFIYHSVKASSSPNLYITFINYIYNNLPLAIDVFFILSSFLLTWLGLNEYDEKDNFSFKNYFTRRVLRIWPLYYLIMTFAFLILPYVAKEMHVPISLPEAGWYLFFVSNFYYIDHVYFLRFLWTLSVEEQFYLLLGFCLKVFYDYLVFILVMIAIISVAFSLFTVNRNLPYETHTITYFFDFALGGLSAFMLFKRAQLIQWILHLSNRQTALFYTYLPVHFIILYVFYRNCTSSQYSIADLISRWLFIVYVSIFIIEQMANKKRTAIFEKNRFLIFTGKISYGLYCFHGISLTFGTILFNKIDFIPLWIKVLVIFAVNYAISIISFYYFETPFLRLKKRFR